MEKFGVKENILAGGAGPAGNSVFSFQLKSFLRTICVTYMLDEFQLFSSAAAELIPSLGVAQLRKILHNQGLQKICIFGD